jgi:hypothetical protein
MSSAPRAIHCRTRFRTQSRSADFIARAQRFFEALKDKPGRKIVWIISVGGGDPLGKLGDLETGLYGIELSIGGNILVTLAAYKRFPGLEGAACTSSFSRHAQRSLALRPAHSRGHLYVTSYTEGFSHFVTSMTAPVVSGWSGRRVGLPPIGKRRLLTAHT